MFRIYTYTTTGIKNISQPTTLANARRLADQANAWNIAKGYAAREIVQAAL